MAEEPTNRCEILAMLPKHSVGAELGVQRARFSMCMLRIVEPRILYLVDAWRQQKNGNMVDIVRTDEEHRRIYEYAQQKLQRFRAAADIRVIRAQTTEAAEQVPDASLDWVYIDAAHTYPCVLADLRAWYPKVVAGGVIAGHDYLPNYYGQLMPMKALGCFRDTSDWGCGVIAAVTQFRGEVPVGPLHVTQEQAPSFWFRKTGGIR